MKFLDILKTVGTGVIEDVVPGGKGIIELVNSVLPDEYKLNSGASGEQVMSSLDKITPENQVMLISKQYDVDIEQLKQSYGTLNTMLVTDATSKHTTRPRIALGSFYVVAFVTTVTILSWAYAVCRMATVTDDPVAVVQSIVNGWPFITSILGIYSSLLLAYFGILKGEHSSKLNASNQLPTNGGVGMLMGLVSKFKK